MSVPSASRFKVMAVESLDANGLTLSGHARQRMIERQIGADEVIYCIRRGYVEEGPALDIRGHWRATMARADHSIRVVLSINPETRALVVTVF